MESYAKTNLNISHKALILRQFAANMASFEQFLVLVFDLILRVYFLQSKQG